MKKLTAACFICLFSLVASAQENITETLKTLTEAKDYDKVITNYASDTKNYPPKALYYIALAYYAKEEDADCLKFLDLSIAGDPKDPQPHYLKSSVYQYMKKTADAIQSIKDAIAIKPEDPVFYSRLGDIYFDSKNYEPAIAAYKKATALKECPSYPFLMVGQTYLDWGNKSKALEAYYHAKKNIPPGTVDFRKAVLNIGNIELAGGNYDKARAVYEESIANDPGDYHALGNLIQILYHDKNYEKALALKDKLYQAHKSGATGNIFKEMFCFDIFNWNGKKIEAYERFEDGPEKSSYDKHIFFVVNAKDEVDFTVQTEYSKADHDGGKPKYMLFRSKDKVHSSYNIGFNDRSNYEEMKKAVLDVLDEKIKPQTSTPEEN